MGSSVALGVIAGKCGSLRLVLAGPAGCFRGRWRSGPRKRRHAAGSRARVSKHRAPVGALRPERPALMIYMPARQQAPCTCRCIKTKLWRCYATASWRQQAPCTCRCIKTIRQRTHDSHTTHVSKHRAPVGALRPAQRGTSSACRRCQQAPCTCRCIKTPVASLLRIHY